MSEARACPGLFPFIRLNMDCMWVRSGARTSSRQRQDWRGVRAATLSLIGCFFTRYAAESVRFFLLASAALLLLFPASGQCPVPAFPGAEGWGACSRGGRGGVVLKVTNLHDSGPGSFREAVSHPAPRTVLFEVSGTITLETDLTIVHPYLTIAGQTAPGEGICLRGFPLNLANTHDIVIRSIRVRPGTGSGLKGSEINALEIRNSENIIVDHCSFSWSTDEGLNNWHGSKNVTIQWCMMSEPLHRSIHEKGPHGYGASLGADRLSFHHNLMAHCYARNPSIAGNNQNLTLLMDFRNCVIYNWAIRSCDGKPVSINVINNYFKSGPATLPAVRQRIARIDNSEGMGFSGLWHIGGNHVEGFPAITADNWKGGVDFDRGASEARNRSLTPFRVAPVTTQQAADAYRLVLERAGVLIPARDSHEKRIVSEVQSASFSCGDKGLVDNVEQAGGWPELKSGTPRPDSDNDGMPDDWESANRLNPADPGDAALAGGTDGYTNIERYINEQYSLLMGIARPVNP